MADRLNFIYILTGKKGCGKSTLALKVANAANKKIVVVGTDDNDVYADFEKVSLENLPYSNAKNIFCITEEPIKCFDILNKHCTNRVVIIEDGQKFINSDVQKEVKTFIINHRMRNFDVLFMYHSLKFIPPYIAQQYNKILLFKTVDVPSGTLKSKFHNFHFIENKMSKVRKNYFQYFFQIINDSDG